MSKEVVPIRSKNNNVFYRGSYGGNWSRILFHDAGGKGMLRFRQRYGIPNHIRTIELDLTPVNGFTSIWELQKTHLAHFRLHSSDLTEGRELYGKLPVSVQQEMLTNMSEETVKLLLHADFLPYLDFDKDNYGIVTFADLIKEPMDLREFFARGSYSEGGPGILLEDAKEDYDHYLQKHQQTITALTPVA